MTDELDRIINRYLDRVDHDPDEIDGVLAEYGSAHASERLDRERRKTTPTRIGKRCRATSLTIMSPDALLQEAASRLADDERLVLGDDGFSVEILADVEDGEEVEGEITVVLRD